VEGLQLLPLGSGLGEEEMGDAPAYVAFIIIEEWGEIRAAPEKRK